MAISCQTVWMHMSGVDAIRCRLSCVASLTALYRRRIVDEPASGHATDAALPVPSLQRARPHAMCDGVVVVAIDPPRLVPCRAPGPGFRQPQFLRRIGDESVLELMRGQTPCSLHATYGTHAANMDPQWKRLRTCLTGGNSLPPVRIRSNALDLSTSRGSRELSRRAPRMPSWWGRLARCRLRQMGTSKSFPGS
jgi:hypothetical protein